MNLYYRSIDGRPVIPMAIHSNGNTDVYQMVVDTGADVTCFPAHYASSIGHDNSHANVKKQGVRGVGGKSQCYLHTINLSLFDPKAKTNPSGSLPPTIWTSSIGGFQFVDKLKGNFGLLGRDIIREWKRISILAAPDGKWYIHIII